VYGLQSRSLAESLKVSQSAADVIINYLKNRFPHTFQWIEKKEADLADSALAADYFGRKRDFSNDPPYKRRNFEVQSPASLICLERLCALHKMLPENILMHIHDGYVFAALLHNCVDVIHTARDILESESPLAPGLSLKVACQVGQQLDNLRTINLSHK
jgi:DNA polymerase I-like protein with 3'-5' exonuclease and polymerase domains